MPEAAFRDSYGAIYAVTNPQVWPRERADTGPIVLADQGGHWMVTRQTAYNRLYKLFADCMKAGGHGI
jgi:hypothetical protein